MEQLADDWRPELGSNARQRIGGSRESSQECAAVCSVEPERLCVEGERLCVEPKRLSVHSSILATGMMYGGGGALPSMCRWTGCGIARPGWGSTQLPHCK